MGKEPHMQANKKGRSNISAKQRMQRIQAQEADQGNTKADPHEDRIRRHRPWLRRVGLSCGHNLQEQGLHREACGGGGDLGERRCRVQSRRNRSRGQYRTRCPVRGRDSTDDGIRLGRQVKASNSTSEGTVRAKIRRTPLSICGGSLIVAHRAATRPSGFSCYF